MKLGTAVAALATAALMGCASLPAPDGPPPALAHSGRLGLRVDAAPGRDAQSLTAEFELRGDARAGSLNLATPVGTQLAQARWATDGVWLQTPQGVQRYASLEALAQQALGEALPLAALPDWLAGRPSPALPPATIQGTGFTQGEWRVDTSQRSEGRVDVLRERAPAVRLRFRLDNPAS